MEDNFFYYRTTELVPIFNETVAKQDHNYKTIDTMMKVYPPIFIFIGTIGNSLSLVIWNKLLSGTVTAVFIVGISVSNLVGLYLEPLTRSTYHWYQYDMRKTTDLCKTVYILNEVTANCSVWFVFALCLERSARLLQINGSDKGRKRAIAFTILVTLVSFFLSCHSIVTVKTDIIKNLGVSVFQTTSSLVCGVQVNNIFTSGTDFNFFWFHQLMHCVFPCTLMTGCAIATGQMLHAHKRGNINPCLKRGIPITASDVELARTTMFLGIMEVICTVPVTIYKTQVDVIQTGSEDLTYALTVLFVHIDYTFKFIVYIAFNENFRRSLAGLFRTGVLLRQQSVQKLRRLSKRRLKRFSIDINMELISARRESAASSVEEVVETSSVQLSSGRSCTGEKKFEFDIIPEINEDTKVQLGTEHQSTSEI